MQNIATNENLRPETVKGKVLEEEDTWLKFMTGSLCSYNALFLIII
jgi:hypothetical protein